MTKKLYRSKNNKVIAGVCAGFAEYFGHDPVAWRVGAVVLLILSGLMPLTLIYLLAWLFIPENPGFEYEVKKEGTVE